MKRLPRWVLLTIVATALLTVLGAAPLFAGTQDGAVVMLHAAPRPQQGDACLLDPATAGTPCSEFTTSWPLLSPCDVYLIVARGDPGPGVAGLSCGVLYNQGETGVATKSDGAGVDVYTWTLCASGLLFPNPWPDHPDDWPASGGGRRITWDASVDCQRDVVGGDGVHTLAGVFYVYAYSDDLFEITPNRTIETNPEEFQIADCSSTVSDITYPLAAGAVAFGSGEGRNPCLAIPVQPTSWSTLKQVYRAQEDEP